MREIKFRVLDKDGDMRFPPPVHEWDFNDCQYFSEYTNKDTAVMQFTGLLDKNGKEIYEGDILAHMSTRRKGYQKDGNTVYKKIVYGRSNPQCNSVTDYIGFWAVSLNDTDISCGGSIGYQINSMGAEVIGNIHENPELLQK